MNTAIRIAVTNVIEAPKNVAGRTCKNKPTVYKITLKSASAKRDMAGFEENIKTILSQLAPFGLIFNDVDYTRDVSCCPLNAKEFRRRLGSVRGVMMPDDSEYERTKARWNTQDFPCDTYLYLDNTTTNGSQCHSFLVRLAVPLQGSPAFPSYRGRWQDGDEAVEDLHQNCLCPRKGV